MSVAKKIFKEEFDCEVYVNDIYQVNVQRNKQADYMVREATMKGKMTYLSIKRLDKKSIHDWRHLQEIKNELLSEGYYFYSNTDTEVVLNSVHYWGIEKALKKLIL